MKKWVAILLAAMMVFCLAACSNKGEQTDGTASETATKSAASLENANIQADEANAQTLKSLLASEFMNNPDTFDTSATYYLTADGRWLQLTSDCAMEYVSDKYKANGYISGSCNKEGVVTVNCSGVSGGGNA